MKYYFDEYEKDYKKVKELGFRARNELYGDSFEKFCMRPFLEKILNNLKIEKENPKVLEYGIGAGPVAWFFWVNYFRIGHSNRVFKKARNIVINKLLWYVKRKRKGKFRWKKWSTNELFDKYKLYNDYRIRYYQKA